MACAGLGIQYPHTKIEKHRITVSVKLNETQSSAPEGFCDEEDQELFKFDPRTIVDPKHKEKLDEQIAFEHYWHMQFWLVNAMRRVWFSATEYPSLSQTIHGFTQQAYGFYYLRDYCEKNYPDRNPHKCALTMAAFKPLAEYGTMLTGAKRIYLPDQHDDLKAAVVEMREIDDVFEVDGELYDSEDHYTAVETQRAKERGDTKGLEAGRYFEEAAAKDEL